MHNTILIVDDSEHIRIQLELYLKSDGYTNLIFAESAGDALKQLGRGESEKGDGDGEVDLILLDIKMPEVDGIETCHRIKTIEYLKDVPIIMVTASTDTEDLRAAFEAGAIDYVTKPMNKIELLARVRSVLKLKCEMDCRKDREKMLHETIKALNKANKEIEDFIYIISHDLKEPLFAIEGYTKRLFRVYEDTIDEKGKSYISRIRANIETMSKRIYEIMEVIKVGAVKYDFKNNDCGILINDVIKTLEIKISTNKINLSIQENLPVVLCDEKRLRDVFFNLVSNAIKFMGDDNQKEINIGCDKEGDYYKIFIEDTGIGIRSEHHEQIFAIFRRLKEVEIEGTGVGLAIVKKIVELHNGKIWVESPVNEGRGSRFCFTIPII